MMKSAPNINAAHKGNATTTEMLCDIWAVLWKSLTPPPLLIAEEKIGSATLARMLGTKLNSCCQELAAL